MNWREHILSDPQIIRGKPCIKDTRIPVALILGYLAAGRDTAAIQREFPDLTVAGVAACLVDGVVAVVEYEFDPRDLAFPESPFTKVWSEIMQHPVLRFQLMSGVKSLPALTRYWIHQVLELAESSRLARLRCG